MEETRNELREFNPLSRADVIAAGYRVNAPGTSAGRPLTVDGMRYQYMSQPRITRKSNYQNWFPSVVLKYKILQNFDVQAGFNRAIGRPAVDDLTGLWTIDENAQRVTAPNAELLPEFHKKYQARIAYYFTGKSPGQLTLSLSQVESRNFVQTFDYSASAFGVEDPDFASYTFRSKSNSIEPQRYRNMDLAYNQTLGFLPSEYLRGISYGLNYARSYADQRRPGTAPHRISSRLGYAFRRFNANFAMIWADRKPESSTYGRYFEAITKFDLTLGWRFSPLVSLYVQGRNISNMTDRWYQSPLGVPEGKQAHLRAMEEYGANWVFGVKGGF